MSYTIVEETPSLFVLEKMELVHPPSIRWNIFEKRRYVMGPGCKGFWIMNGVTRYAGEILLGLGDIMSVEGASISVLPSYKGLSYGKILTEHALGWAREKGYRQYVGDARPGASWHIVESMGAEQVGLSVNHGETGEDYVSFVLNL
jgi:GNAT superfamily N-acetyltransferase